MRPALRPFQDAAESRKQAEEIHLELGLVVVAHRVGDARIGTCQLCAAQRLAIVQELRRRLVLLMLQQPPHQRFTWILFRPHLVVRAGPRQQHS